MVSRFALLAPECLEILPVTATEQDVGLCEGHFYGATLQPGVQLYWKQSPLSWLANPGASALSGAHVCGDAILSLAGPFGSEQEVQTLLSSLLAKVSPRSQLPMQLQSCLDDAKGEEPAAPGSHHGGGTGLIPGLLQGSPADSQPGLLASASGNDTSPTQPGLPNPSPGSASDAAVPSSSTTASAGSTPTATVAPAPTSPVPRPATAGLALNASSSGNGGFEPRQQLLWAIASRATSISWAPSTPRPRPAPTPLGPGADAAGQGPAGSQGPADSSSGSLSGSSGGSDNSSSVLLEEASLGGGVAAGGEDEGGECGASCCASDDSHARGWAPWASARPEILELVVAQAGYGASFALLLSHVCAGWRQGVHAEHLMLRMLRFKKCALLGGAGAAGAGRCRAARAALRRDQQELPWLVVEAARAGNVSAAVVAARYLEARRSPAPTDEAWFWNKAARKGHPEAQAKIGLAYYKGSLGLAWDCEEAMLWLSRSAKQLSDHLASLAPQEASPASPRSAAEHGALLLLESAGSGSGGGGGAGAAGTVGSCDDKAAQAVGGPAGAPVPLLMSPLDCRRCLSQVAHMLGLLHLDGEGTKKDLVAGIKWLKVAEQCGCMEAGKVLGSLYNTGQYG